MELFYAASSATGQDKSGHDWLTHSWAKKQNPAKNSNLKNSWNWQVILIPTTVWQTLSIKLIPGNGNRCKLAEIHLEKLVKSHQWNLFCRGVMMNVFHQLTARRAQRYSTAAHSRLTQVYSHTCTAVAVNVRFSQHRSRSAECAVALPPVDLTEKISSVTY